MKVETYACNECRVQRKDANHWFKGYMLPNDAGVVIVQWDVSRGVRDGDSLLLNTEDADAHLCGANCVTEWLSKNLL